MTSQQKPGQSAQDDRYSNQDKAPHRGPLKTLDNQPGPKIETDTPSDPEKGRDVRK